MITLTAVRRAETGEIESAPLNYLPLANILWPHIANKPSLARTLFQTIESFNPDMRRRLAPDEALTRRVVLGDAPG